MKVVATHWGSRGKSWAIMDAELPRFERGGPEIHVDQGEWGQVRAHFDAINKMIVIRWSQTLRLKGDYAFYLRLDKSEVLNAFVTAFGDASLDELVSMIPVDKRRKATRANQDSRNHRLATVK